jgi:hypothetical protein
VSAELLEFNSCWCTMGLAAAITCGDALQAALQLSEEQVAHMVQARREFLASLKALLQQRRALGDIICASITKDCNSNPAVSTQHSKVRASTATLPILAGNQPCKRRQAAITCTKVGVANVPHQGCQCASPPTGAHTCQA